MSNGTHEEMAEALAEKRESDIKRIKDAGVEVERYEDGVQINAYVDDLFLSKMADLIELQEHVLSK